MATIAAFLLATLDGHVAGPAGEFDHWLGLDEEFAAFSVSQLDAASALLFGRFTYQGMADYWTSDAARSDDPDVHARMTSLTKFVASTSLTETVWTGTSLVRGAAEIASLRGRLTGEILVLGSPTLTAALIHHQLLDELRVMINPLVLGHGRPLLPVGDGRVPLTLLSAATLESGNVLLTYRPDTEGVKG